ncbi:MAG: cytochrome c [Planctomycetes bacterium]|nr:cytochrome c [Planctomycetota bacterium]
MNTSTIRLLTCLASLVLVACDGGDSGDSAASTAFAKVSRAEAQQQFKTLCFACHGEFGRGDGPGAAALDPKPRNFADPKWQASVTDEHIKSVILRGGAAVGKSPLMPAQPQLKSQPDLLAAIVGYVRSLKQQ